MIAQVNLNETRALHLQAKARALLSAGRPREALESAMLAYEADAARVDNLILLGALHYELRDHKETDLFSKQCIAVDGNCAEGYNNQGCAAVGLGDRSKAMDSFLKATKLKPKYADPYCNLGNMYLEDGIVQDAIATYKLALSINPNFVEVHSNLGNAHRRIGEFELAKQRYLEAIKNKQEFAVAWNNLAGLYRDLNQTQTAIAYYKEALRHNPLLAEIHNNLGNAFRDSNMPYDAITSYKEALKLKPKFCAAMNNLAATYYDIGDIAQSITTFKQAMLLDPRSADLQSNLANALSLAGRFEDAIQAFRDCLRIDPENHFAYNNLGNVLRSRGMVREAMHCYVTAIRLLPTFAAAHSNLGAIFREQGRPSQALSHFHEAVKLEPLLADAYCNMGSTYLGLGDGKEAVRCLRAALKINAKLPLAQYYLGLSHRFLGEFAPAVTALRQALRLKPDLAAARAELLYTHACACDFSTRQHDYIQVMEDVEASLLSDECPSLQPLHSLIFPFSSKQRVEIARRHAARAKDCTLLDERLLIHKPREASARLKVGYVCSRFSDHHISRILQTVIAQHNKRIVDVYVYSLGPLSDSCRDAIEGAVEKVRDMHEMTSGDAAEQISKDGINILVSLDGYACDSRMELFALRPAPIQAHLLGYPGTLGADYIQYVITDANTVPPGCEEEYSESVVRMPHTLLGDHRLLLPELTRAMHASSRQDQSLPDNHLVFCHFGPAHGIDPDSLEMWLSVLDRVPNSVLWLIGHSSTMVENLREYVRTRTTAGRRDHSDRLVFAAPEEDREAQLRRALLADIYLESKTCSSPAVADALWLGTPVVSLKGSSSLSRSSSAALMSVGAHELIADSSEQYVDLAVGLAEPSRRERVRRSLEEARYACPGFDVTRWVRLLEAAYTDMWVAQKQGGPRHIDVREEDHPSHR